VQAADDEDGVEKPSTASVEWVGQADEDSHGAGASGARVQGQAGEDSHGTSSRQQQHHQESGFRGMHLIMRMVSREKKQPTASGAGRGFRCRQQRISGHGAESRQWYHHQGRGFRGRCRHLRSADHV
jgi:hypothetical protein